MKSSMRKRRTWSSSVGLIVGFIAFATTFIGCSGVGSVSGPPPPGTVTVYNAIPGLLPPNMASAGFQATQTSEFGDYIHLAGANRLLKAVTVTMSDWAMRADYPLMPSSGWSHPVTLNIYSAVAGTPLNSAGGLLGTVTQSFIIPWRPPSDPLSPDGTSWKGSDGGWYHGLAFNITFDFESLNITLPSGIIVGVAYNTQTYGRAPIGTSGPYNSLNVGVVGSATAGTDDNTDRVFWNTSTAASYADGGFAGSGVFREDTGWAAVSPWGTLPVQIKAAP